ncbi:hypothetical protein PGT21_016563 [Puccinia graminis f. sp. tritici]|uniref:Uncharacterized protein n=1 Tax=Puccinia graminis f. sp. tritici TaxID=56615 RepID=A0A5B0QTB0_PUCGR|nr:hypothetical protein PGT21_016563 [Puccinia graminis f. sp. tritici]
MVSEDPRFLDLSSAMGRTRGQPNLTTKKKAWVAGMFNAGMSHTNAAKVNY